MAAPGNLPRVQASGIQTGGGVVTSARSHQQGAPGETMEGNWCAEPGAGSLGHHPCQCPKPRARLQPLVLRAGSPNDRPLLQASAQTHRCRSLSSAAPACLLHNRVVLTILSLLPTISPQKPCTRIAIPIKITCSFCKKRTCSFCSIGGRSQTSASTGKPTLQAPPSTSHLPSRLASFFGAQLVSCETRY